MEVFNNMQEQRLEILFQRFINKSATAAERDEFFELVKLPGANEALKMLADRYPVRDEQVVELPQQASGEILTAIFNSEGAVHMPEQRLNSIRSFWWAAAAVLVLLATGAVFFLNKRESYSSVVAKVTKDIKAPTSNKAIITLPDGRQIMLDTISNGTLIAGVVRKAADDQLEFEDDHSGNGYFIATNPRNSTALQITLPDQTKVWLNADTYLEYPDSYTRSRMVRLKGEAYFEVKHNSQKLFKVSAGGQTIEDAGTSFNVKAYKTEAGAETTLVEGEVKIDNIVSLKPGQKYSKSKISDANIDEAMAWRNGSFYLDGSEFEEVANEIARWYDVEVVFNNPAAAHSMVTGGEIGRNLSLLQAIGILKELKVNCRLEGRKLIVE